MWVKPVGLSPEEPASALQAACRASGALVEVSARLVGLYVASNLFSVYFYGINNCVYCCIRYFVIGKNNLMFDWVMDAK